jgi:hypothetical protein
MDLLPQDTREDVLRIIRSDFPQQDDANAWPSE